MNYQLVVYVKNPGGGVDTLLLPQPYKTFEQAVKARDVLLKEVQNRDLTHVVTYNIVPSFTG